MTPGSGDGRSTVAGLVAIASGRLLEAGSTSARLDAELLMGHALGIDRTGVIAHGASPVPAPAAAAFEGFVVRREAGEPVAYIRGTREFHGLALAADARALVPRPETEQLVDEAVAEIARRLTSAPRAAGAAPVRVVDVGTGTGAIAVAVVSALRRRRMDHAVHVTAVDISADALALAMENAVAHGVADRMAFHRGDLFDGLGDGAEALDGAGGARFDVVCANLPYVTTGAIAGLAKDLAFEPVLALDGGPDGLDVIRRLLDQLPSRLVPGGVALLEIGHDQGESILAACAQHVPGWPASVAADLAGLPRLARVERPVS